MRAAAALAAAALGLYLGAAHATGSGVQQHLTLDQSRVLAAHALQTGRPGLALKISEALIKADGKDHMAWHLQAAAYSALSNPRAGRKSAARAYRFSPGTGGKYQAAQLASRLAYAEGNPTLSQYWLRRTAIHAPDEQAEKLIARDYRLLRQVNPWAFRLRGEVKPSNNVNNGSDSTLEIIDGLPSTGGRYGPRSVALSGVVGIVDATVSRRLRQSQTSLTSLSGRLYMQRVALSSSAKATAAELAALTATTVPRNSEFASTYGEITLTHAFAAGPREKKGSAVAAVSLATSWYGGEKSYDLVKVSGNRSWRLNEASGLTIDGSAEQRFNPRSRSYDATVLGVGATFSHRLEGGGKFNLTLGLRDTDSEHVNTSFTTASLRLAYTFGQKVGPARISSGLILGHSDYPVFIGGYGQAYLPDGRRDQSLYADLNLFFEDYDYAGFAPMLRLRAGKRESNHNRFESDEFSVSLGIESKF